MSRTILKWDAESDGDSTHRPSTLGETAYRLADPDYQLQYRHKLGQQLMGDTGRAAPGKHYVLDRLPDGYTLWERSRPSNPKHVDRYLYGHPKHQLFDSPYTFLPHLMWLSDDKEGACQCMRCGKHGRSSKPSSFGKASAGTGILVPHRGRPFSKGSHVDAEGVPCPIPIFLNLLKKEGTLDRLIEENLSMDWCVENKVNRETRDRLSTQSSFVPRVGEIVIWYWAIDGELRIELVTGQLKVWNGKAFTGHPTWLGGVVTMVPVASESIQLEDVTHETKKTLGVTSSGFRIECYPDPEEDDKNFSKQYSYVPMRHIRPVSFLLDTIKGIPEADWHPTIFNIIKAMSCVSCIDRYKFKGVWPDFHINYRGMFFGAESYWIGDPIRLLPRKERQHHVTEVIIPLRFIVRTYNVKANADGTVTGTKADKIELVIQGHIYTIDARFSKGLSATFPPSSVLHAYGPWYHLESQRSKHEIQYQHTLGRVFEYEAMKQWYPNIGPEAALDAGFGSVTFARNISIQKRISEDDQGSGYFWAENRAEALDLATFNGVSVGAYDTDRDPHKWRHDLTVLKDDKDFLAKEPAVRGPAAALAGVFILSQAQPTGKGKEKVVIDIDSGTSSEEVDVDETIEGLISGERFRVVEDVIEDEDAGSRSTKRARVQ